MDEARIGPTEDAAIVDALPAVVPEIAPDAGVVSLALAAAIDHAKAYARDAHAAETLRAYRHDWGDFVAWCRRTECAALPAEPRAIAAYLASLASHRSRSLLDRRLAAIGYQHKLHGLEWNAGHPAIRSTLRGIGRSHGRHRQRRQAAALTSVEIKQLLKVCPADLGGARDRALLLLAFSGALRRSELVGLDHDDIRQTATGLRLTIRSSKTDAEAAGVELGIPRGKQPETCPVRALADWLARAAIDRGPIFRKVDQWGHVERDRLGADGVRRILKRRARQAGLTVDASERLSPHGLRAGFVTEAYMAGARDEQIMAHSRHKDLKTMRGYVRRARLVSDSPVKLLDI